jgi:hypothetical protein
MWVRYRVFSFFSCAEVGSSVSIGSYETMKQQKEDTLCERADPRYCMTKV